MKKLTLTLLTCATLAFSAGLASAGNDETVVCSKNPGHWKCQTASGQVFNVSNVNSAEAAAEAVAAAIANASSTGGAGGAGGAGGNSDQEQSQGQGQSQTSENNNRNTNMNGGNSVNFEGDPAHTTSLNANVGLNVTLPIGAGIQAASCRDTVRLAREMGQETLALNIFLECPHVRKLNLKVNPGDKG